MQAILVLIILFGGIAGIIYFFCKQRSNAGGEGSRASPGVSSPSKKALIDLKKKLKEIGNPQYPFLHKEYSPSSRIPCTDFTTFIIERLRLRDFAPISTLMMGIIEANPGLGTDSGWISDQVMSVVRIDFAKYLVFENLDSYNHLRAMWIMAEKDGGGREFWILGDFPKFFAQALSPFKMSMGQSIYQLRKKANRFIRKMRKEVPYSIWTEIPTIKEHELTIPPFETNECFEIVRNMTIGGRLLLFSCINNGGGVLPKLAYVAKDIGINALEASMEVVSTKLLIPSHEPLLLKNSLTKDELIGLCEKAGSSYKKSWNKDKLIDSLSHSKENFKYMLDDFMPVSVNSKYQDDLNALIIRSKTIEPIFRVLCFI